jgi:hypothetical protein
MSDSPESDESLKSFVHLCAERGFLTQPKELENGDPDDGLSEPHTLLYVPITLLPD